MIQEYHRYTVFVEDGFLGPYPCEQVGGFDGPQKALSLYEKFERKYGSQKVHADKITIRSNTDDGFFDSKTTRVGSESHY